MSLSRRLAHFVPLSEDEMVILQDLEARRRSWRRHRDIMRENTKCDVTYLVVEGFLMRWRLLPNGARQVISIAIPGDIVDFPGSCFEPSLYSVTAVTDVVLSSIPHLDLVSLWKTCPSLASKLFWSFAADAAICMEHLVDIGRRSARERVTRFLLEFYTRLQIVGHADDASFSMPLTQEVIADLLGLSVPHVNRTLRQLREDDMIAIDEQRITLKNREEMAALSDFKGRIFRRFNFPGAVLDLAPL